MNHKTTNQIHLILELELAIETVKSGLSIIQSVKDQGFPSFLIFLLLSTGLERILKIIIGMQLLSNLKPFPTAKELKKKYGHSLIKLRDEVLLICYDKKQFSSSSMFDDYHFLKDDILLNELINHLSEFATSGRYLYMDRISNESSTGKWLSHRWAEIEEKIAPQENPIDRLDDRKEIIKNSIVKCIEKLLRALVRRITLGRMDMNSNSAGTLLHQFLFLREDQLGEKKYQLFGFQPI